jgi:hypothetical protein
MNIQTQVKQTPHGVDVVLSGSDAGQIDSVRLQRFLNSRLGCAVRNHCELHDSPEIKAKCLEDLIQHKYVEPEAKATHSSQDGVVHLEGDAKLKSIATPERVLRMVQNFASCRAENHCSPKQSVVERWHCVNTLAQRVLAR